MNILFFKWSTTNENLVICSLKKLGHTVIPFQKGFDSYEIDAKLMQLLLFEIQKNTIDCLFSLDFFPFLSSVANTVNIPYISWLQDSPAFPLFSPTRNYTCNYQFVFDKDEYSRLLSLGSNRIYPITLASDPAYFASQIEKYKTIKEDIDVCFLGTLYSETDFERIAFCDDYLKGYINSLIYAQKGLYGCNIIEKAIPDKMAKEILSMSGDTIPSGYCIDNSYAAAYVLERKVTSLERIEYLKAIGEKYPLTIFTGSTPDSSICANYNGYVDYETIMPLIFNSAKINLHFAPRNIHSGISLRVFDVLACKGFLLTTWQPEIAEYFVDGKELVLFSDVEDLLEKIDYYLKHEKERKEIAEAGYEKVKSTFTYEKVLQGIFKIVH